MSETFLTVGAVFGGCGCVFKTAWQEHAASYLDIPLPDMLSACVFLSA